MNPPPAIDPNEAARQELELLFRLPKNQADATAELIKQFLERHPGICEHQNEDGELPLHTAVAVEEGCPLAILELLVSAYPEALTSTTNDSWTPLLYACCISASLDLKVFQLLATPATLLSRKDKDGGLPLHNYCFRGPGDDYAALDAEVLEFLMGGDPNILLQVDINGNTPLHCALSGVIAGNVPAIQWLINQCPPQVFMIRDREEGWTPLHCACQTSFHTGDDDEIIRLLTSKCTEATMLVTDVVGDTALHLYCQTDPPSRLTLKAMLQACPQSARLMNHQGKYPVELVYEHFDDGDLNTRELELLIDAFGEDLLTIRDDEGKTVLHRAIDSSLHVDIIRILTSKFKSFLEGNPEGRTLLHYLCAKTGLDASDKVDYLQVLLAASPEHATSARNGAGETALHVLCSNEELTVEQLWVFVTMGHAVTARGPQGQTPVHVLCSNNNVSEELLQVLLPTYPEFVMAQDNIGQLPLHKMALKNEAVVAKPTFQAALHSLLAAFPNAIHVLDADGMTPLEVAYCDTEDASLTLAYLLFRLDPVAVLTSWQGARDAVDEE